MMREPKTLGTIVIAYAGDTNSLKLIRARSDKRASYAWYPADESTGNGWYRWRDLARYGYDRLEVIHDPSKQPEAAASEPEDRTDVQDVVAENGNDYAESEWNDGDE